MMLHIFTASQKESAHKIKTMLIAFFDSNGLIHQDFVPQGQTVNAEFYEGVLKRLLQRIPRVRPELYRSRRWKLLHDNARPHTANRVVDFLAKHQVVVIDHPPYSPDVSPADFFLFPRLTGVLKGVRFSSVEEIQQRVTA